MDFTTSANTSSLSSHHDKLTDYYLMNITFLLDYNHYLQMALHRQKLMGSIGFMHNIHGGFCNVAKYKTRHKTSTYTLWILSH